jgi:hypothetical protein
MDINYYLSIVILIFITCIIYSFKVSKYVKDYYDHKKRLNTFVFFSEIWAIFNTSKEEAFNTLYRQDLSVFFTSRVNNNEKKDILKKFEKTFIKKVIDLCGPKIVEDLKNILGDTDSIIINLSNFYATKIIELEMETSEVDMKSSFSDDEIQELNKTMNGIFK